jgi:hypothetical protein
MDRSVTISFFFNIVAQDGPDRTKHEESQSAVNIAAETVGGTYSSIAPEVCRQVRLPIY